MAEEKPIEKRKRVRKDVFQTILSRAAKAGIIPLKSRDSNRWFRQQAKALRTQGNTIIRHLGKAGDLRSDQIYPGEMYIFEYDAKHKDTLPYWDRFPVIFCVRLYGGRGAGMLGINLHYLPLTMRAKLMDALMTLRGQKDGRIRLALTYQILKSASRYAFFRPCLKRYLASHLRTKVMRIEAEEWSMAAWLPGVAKWVGASQEEVWRASSKMMRGIK